MLTRIEVIRIECLLHSAHVSERWHSHQRLAVARLLKRCRDSAGDTGQQRSLLLELWQVLGATGVMFRSRNRPRLFCLIERIEMTDTKRSELKTLKNFRRSLQYYERAMESLSETATCNRMRRRYATKKWNLQSLLKMTETTLQTLTDASDPELRVTCGVGVWGDWKTPTATECQAVADSWDRRRATIVPQRWQIIYLLMLAGV
jgi:hypothetical protein